ncbi:MAG: holo-ACP synthase [Planctomycetes bacterium]|nr:holo-ACP synthase [Planctomycetota bacterium]MCW8137073.1 holo-ACP synthase [Planctomycetota bacterium]
MAILGIGTDIVEVARIERLLRDKGDDFKARVFTPAEIDYCRNKANPALHYAGRFAAKEAFMKAIGTGWAKGVGFGEIGVLNNDEGKPALHVSGEAKKVLDGFGPSFLWLSISHTRQYATATVIIESEADKPFRPPQAPYHV